MTDIKMAVAKAKTFALETLGGAHGDYSLEEMERDTYKGRDVWMITLGMPKNVATPIEAVAPDAMRALFGPREREYKTFIVDTDTGEVLAMKLRVLAGS
jgi:hypothetical protein